MTAWGSVLSNPASPGSINVNFTRAMVGLFNPGGDATLNSVGVYMHDTNTGTYRLAVYQGGTSDTNPAGATLIWQSGQLTAPGASGWDDEAASGTLVNNTRTWIFIKDNDNNVVLQTTSSSGERSNATTGGRVAVYEHTGGDDETASFPATMNNGSQDSYTAWYRMRLDYTLGGGGGGGYPFGALAGKGALAGWGGLAGRGGGLAGFVKIGNIYRPKRWLWTPVPQGA